MRNLLMVAAVLALSAAPGLAQTASPAPPTTTPAVASSCKAQASDKKLAGAALNSFMKRCESDATKACATQASDRKLAGAAKASFTKKCVTDAVGAT